MKSTPLFAATTTLFVFTACGGDGSGSVSAAPELAETPSDMSDLVPANTMVFLQLESLDAVDDLADRVARKMMGEEPPMGAAEAIFGSGMFGKLDIDQIDPERPVGIAIDMPVSSFLPTFTAILPVKDSGAFTSSFQGMPGGAEPVARGSFVAVSSALDYAPGEGASELASGLPGGQIGARIDLASLIEANRGMIEMGFAEANESMDMLAGMSPAETGGMDVTAVLEAYLDAARTMLDSAESLDLGVVLEGDNLIIATSYTAKEGSPAGELFQGAALDPSALAGFVDSDSAGSFLFAADATQYRGKLEAIFGRLTEMYPEEMRQGLKDAMSLWMDASDSISGVMAGSFRFDDGFGMEFLMEPKDPAGVVEAYTKGMSAVDMSSFGFDFQAPTSSEVDGNTLTEITCDFDPAKMMATLDTPGGESEEALAMFNEMWGGSDMTMRLLNDDDRVVITMGASAASIEEAADMLDGDGGSVPADLRAILQRAGTGNPAFVYRLDFGTMMNSMLGSMGAPEMPSTPMSFYLSANGRKWNGGASIDIAGFGEMIKNF